MGGDGPQPHPGSRPLTRPPHPCPEPRLGGSPGGSQPEVGRQRSIVKASQRLNHLMIQKSMGKGEGRAEGVASRRAAAAPPLSLPFPASTSDSAGGEKNRSHSGAEARLQHLGQRPGEPESLRSRRLLQHLGQRRERSALRGGGRCWGWGGEKGQKWGEKRNLCHSGSGTPAHSPPPPLPSPSPCV